MTVKLPREVAEAMEGVKEHADESLLYNIQYMHDVCENEKFDAPKFQPIYNWISINGHKEYFKALVIGYEVEQTPEEAVKQYYDWLGDDITARAAVSDILDLLNLTIEGINDK